jgi:O-antigen/teichoic acid export membrane protein
MNNISVHISPTRQFLINTFTQFGASSISAIFNFIFTFLATRTLGVELFGQFSTVQIYVSSFYIFTDLGISNVIVRDVAQNKSNVKEITSNLLVLKLVLGIIVLLLIIIGAHFLNYDINTQQLILLYAISVVPFSISYGCNSIFNGYEKLNYSSITLFVNSIATITSIIFLFLSFGLREIFLGISIISFLSLMVSLYFLWYKFVRFSFLCDLKFWKTVLVKSWPFGLIFVLNTISQSAGPIFLSKISGNVGVGYFNLSNKVIAPIMLFISAYNAAIFPLFSRLIVSSEDMLKRIFPLSFKIMAVIGFSCTIFLIVISTYIIPLFFPGFDDAIIVLKILSWNILFGMLTTVTINILYSEHNEKTVTKIFFSSTLLCLILNFFLIPLWGVVGLSISQIIVAAFQFIASLIFCSNNHPLDVFKVILRAFLGNLPMIILGYFFKWNLLPFLSFASILFILSIIFSPVFNKEDRHFIFKKSLDSILKNVR